MTTGRMAVPEDARAAGAWQDVHVCVAGIGVSGAAAARELAARGARVTAVDSALRNESELPADVDLVVTSPGWRPDRPLFAQASVRGVPIWGEVELAWVLRDRAVPWLAVTGTNGKTTTVQMLDAMLKAAGRRAVAAGNVGLPLLDAVLADPPYDVIAVELSSFQLHWTCSVRPLASAVLNVAPDHLDWHGGLEAYAAAKGLVYDGTEVACVYNADEATTERLVRAAEVSESCRAVGFTLGAPAIDELGVVEDVLVD